MVSRSLARVFCIVLACAAFSSAGESPSPLLLRLQNIDADSNSCALLRVDGSFHFERTHKKRSKILEGSLKSPDMVKLNRWLEDAELRNLTQQQIGSPQIQTRNAVLQVSVFREEHWQDLVFPDEASQQRFQKSLTPLVRWLKRLPKKPHRELAPDAAKTNCSTPGRIELKPRP